MIESNSSDVYNSLAKSGLVRDGDIILLNEISSSFDEPLEREPYCRLFTTYTQKTIPFITYRTIFSNLCEEM